ncbi:hypothetical protein ACFQU2_07395 [Siccirubricoccus deserti]
MQAAGAGGAGTLGGVGRIETTGRSFSELLGRGDGALTVVTVGGNLSALLVDLSGLQSAMRCSRRSVSRRAPRSNA